jgi:hypothetical protein
MRTGRDTISTSDACTAIRSDVYGDIELAGILAYFTFCAFLFIDVESIKSYWIK